MTMSRIPKSQAVSAARQEERTSAASLITYEKRLDSDLRWALNEASLFFEEKGAVHEALRKITKRLDELGIPYSVVGGLALFRHGYRRFTEDVDLLVTPENLRIIHEKLEGLGYVAPFTQSKNLRDTELGVKIEFLLAGGYPGDGKPKPVSFPDPTTASIEQNGIRYLNLSTLVELKIASGMTGAGRRKDLSDVEELIKVLNLSREFADNLNPYVREKYVEIWSTSRRRFIRLWRNKFLTTDAKTLDEMLATFRAAITELESMKKDGVTLDADAGTADDYAHLVTTDPKIAERYGMVEESEFWGEKDEEK
jgi:hypothetical protein